MTNPQSSAYVQYPPTWQKRGSAFLCIFLSLCTGILMSSYHVTASAIGTDVKRDTLRPTTKHLSNEGSLNVVDTIVKPGCNGDICLKPECIHTASNVLKNMDSNVKPCDNFYKFACGSFEESTIVPDAESQIHSFGTVNDKLQEQLRLSFEQEISNNDLKAFKFVKSVYKSCMNERAIEANGLDPLRKIIKKLYGWPALEGNRWKESDFSWPQFIHKSRKLGFFGNYLIRLSVVIDPKNSAKHIIDLDQPYFGVDHEYLLKGFNEPAVQAYYKYMVNTAVLLGAERSNVGEELKKAVEFEIELAKISLRDQDRRNSTILYNPMTLTELIGNYSSIPWKEFFREMLPSDIVIGDDEIIVVDVPSYVAGLQELLKVTPKRVVANYLMWNIATISAPYLNTEMRKLQQDFNAVLYGTSAPKSTWKDCVFYVSFKLPLSVGAMYVQNYFSEEAKENVVVMTKDIENQVINMLNEIEWMDEITRKRAVEKAKAITNYVAYPKELMSDSEIEKYYEKLELSDGSYLDIILKLTRFNRDQSLGKLRKPVTKNEWDLHGAAAVVNAMYSSDENSIEFPAGILQGVFFNNDRPKYMNYGAIGSIIGHEITHGFDDQGRQYDKNGNLLDWWKPTSAEKYLKRAQCVIDQYGNYTVEEVGLNVNGKDTQGENIADNGGAKVAYLAYNNWVARNGKEQKLPGLPYTPNQLFWISMANVWCTKYKRESLRDLVSTDEHPPAEYRVIGTVSNSEAFAKDFNCPLGSKMNPVKKCVVW